MVKESEARAAAAAAAVIASPTRKMVIEDDDIIGEFSQEVMNITLRFTGLPKEEIVGIFHNKFKPINLYQLRQIRGLRFDTFQDQEHIGIEALNLYTALAEFCGNVYKLSTVYEWQDAVLLMAIEAHSYIVAQQPTDPL